jgi:multiple sugar transport system permease protein
MKNDIISVGSTDSKRAFMKTPIKIKVRNVFRNNKGFWYVLPAVLLWLFVGLYTVAFSIALAFHKWNGFGKFTILPKYFCEPPTCRFVGLQNFEKFLTPGLPTFERFINALGNNFYFMIFGTIGVIAIALPLAFALKNANFGSKVFRTLLLLPMATAGIATYYVWKLIYQPAGVLNMMLENIGLAALVVKDGWLGDIHTALGALIGVSIWSGVPFAMILYMAGLQTIPKEVLESAEIDGASSWQRLRYVVWPMLAPITIIVVILNLSGALQGFELQYLMTAGGPTEHTNVVGLLVFTEAFGGWGVPDLGRASALGWSLFILGVSLSLLSLYFNRRNQGATE